MVQCMDCMVYAKETERWFGTIGGCPRGTDYAEDQNVCMFASRSQSEGTHLVSSSLCYAIMSRRLENTENRENE